MKPWIALIALLFACSERDGELESCTTLDYESFGHAFLSEYCTSCHSELTLDNTVRTIAESIELEVVTLRTMPPANNDAQPTADERNLLGEWLRCGAP